MSTLVNATRTGTRMGAQHVRFTVREHDFKACVFDTLQNRIAPVTEAETARFLAFKLNTEQLNPDELSWVILPEVKL